MAELEFESQTLLHHPRHHTAMVFVQRRMNGNHLRIWCSVALMAPLNWTVEHLEVQSPAPQASWEKGIPRRGKEFGLQGAHNPLGRYSDTSGEANSRKAIHHELFLKCIVCMYDIPSRRIPGFCLLCVSVASLRP